MAKLLDNAGGTGNWAPVAAGNYALLTESAQASVFFDIRISTGNAIALCDDRGPIKHDAGLGSHFVPLPACEIRARTDSGKLATVHVVATS